MTATTEPTGDAPVAELVMRARAGDKKAWDALVERYAPLILSICRRYRLEGADSSDVSQNVWLKLVSQLDGIRDPAALPRWLITTTRRECLKALRLTQRLRGTGHLLDAANLPDTRDAMAEQGLLQAERRAALREAFTCLSPVCQQLIALLIEDPPVPYAKISAELGMRAGSIGPMRGRCLRQLRRYPAVAALINAS